jgi:hypothetical protein
LAANERHDSRVHLIAALPSLIPLLASPALVVEGDDILGAARHVCHDKARHPAPECSNVAQKKLRRIVTAQSKPFSHSAWVLHQGEGQLSCEVMSGAGGCWARPGRTAVHVKQSSHSPSLPKAESRITDAKKAFDPCQKKLQWPTGAGRLCGPSSFKTFHIYLRRPRKSSISFFACSLS